MASVEARVLSHMNRTTAGCLAIPYGIFANVRRTPLGCLIPLCFVVGLIALPYLIHNAGLRRFRAAFAQVTHPPSSIALHEFSAVGLLEGNGNHCDYLAGQFRETDLSPVEVVRAYADARVRRVNPKAHDSGFGDYVLVHVEFPEQTPSDISHLHDAATLAAVHAKRTRKTLYLVYAIDSGYPPDFDLRCY